MWFSRSAGCVSKFLICVRLGTTYLLALVPFMMVMVWGFQVGYKFEMLVIFLKQFCARSTAAHIGLEPTYFPPFHPSAHRVGCLFRCYAQYRAK